MKMDVFRFRSALTVTMLSGALAFTACSSDENTDGGVKDTGTTQPDSGTTEEPDSGTNNGGMDATTTDRGPRPDSGPRDGGMVEPPDSGVDPRADQEGGSCTPGATEQGSCVDPANVCVTWSPEGFTTQISTCIRPCESDTDCSTSPAGAVCGNVVAGLEGGRVVGIKACVSAVVGEGERANLSLRHEPAPMTGCAEPYHAYPWFIGSLLFELDDDQASCGLPCGTDADCAASNTTSFCNRGVLNPETATVTPGVCQVRRADKGALCSQSTIIEMCDTSTSANMVCVNLGLTEADNMDPVKEYGHCLEICEMANPTCPSRGDPALAPTCEFGFFTSATLGLCDDNCAAFPDNCSGAGSPPPSGGTQNGMNCTQFGGSFDAPEQGLCLEVAQTETLFDPWDFMNPPAIPCADDAHRCPDATTCIAVDLGGGMQTSACVYGCNTQTATTGCSGAFPSCNQVFGATTRSGVCQQM